MIMKASGCKWLRSRACLHHDGGPEVAEMAGELGVGGPVVAGVVVRLVLVRLLGVQRPWPRHAELLNAEAELLPGNVAIVVEVEGQQNPLSFGLRDVVAELVKHVLDLLGLPYSALIPLLP
eukprot:TRINITY_DN2534_c0_g1_i1.p1 TRINITY_DN2534_c0_g1~~TRINITY_DN2534_c0_g1_i1.p1  ORF type:complete len:121 (+),score=3.33 TRINITY_DN2534_c0_g1_i1:74-436(+)